MPKLLIVDDETATVEMLLTYLTMAGYEAVGAYCGNDGLTMVEVEEPDLIILDLMMPDIEGFEVCAKVRAHPRYSHLPIIIVSARSDAEAIERAHRLGANGYLIKPINLAQLMSEIRRLLT